MLALLALSCTLLDDRATRIAAVVAGAAAVATGLIIDPTTRPTVRPEKDLT